jgi:hypothetical protein
MRQLRKIPQANLLREYRGSFLGNIIYFTIIAFPILSIYKLIVSFQSFNYKNIFISILLFSISLFVFYSLTFYKNYIPKKTFYLERLDKKGLNKYMIITLILVLLFILSQFLIQGKISIKTLIISSSILFTYYYWSKSIKFHEDIDYEANEFLADLIGLSVDEKIVASYQNFDSSKAKRKKNDNLTVVTNRKVFFAVFNGTNWMTLNKLLSEIVKIGIARNDVNSYLKLVFEDNTSLGIRLDLYEKITTTPQLFVKQFLNTLDASLLDYNVVSKNNRRRVSISQENTSVDNNSSNQKRSIELNQTLVNELKTSEEIKSGRILEI